MLALVIRRKGLLDAFRRNNFSNNKLTSQAPLRKRLRNTSVALTGIHHTPVLVHRTSEQRYEIYAMRTFALSVWEWLSDAALPFGYEIEAGA